MPCVDAGKSRGATGATIIPARGTGIREAKTFFGLTLEVADRHYHVSARRTPGGTGARGDQKAGEFHKPGTGIAFVMPVEQVIGLESQLNAIDPKENNR